MSFFIKINFIFFSMFAVACSNNAYPSKNPQKKEIRKIDLKKINTEKKKIESSINYYGKRNHFPSFAVAIVKKNKINYQYCYKTDLHKTYGLASVTKTFTALSVMLLEEQGAINLDTPIKNYLPGVEINYPKFKSKPVTVRHLLSHSSGLPDPRYYHSQKFSKTKGLNYTIPAPIYPAGYHYRYSNHGFKLLSTLVEKISGLSYADYLKKKVFKPLRMKDARTSKKANGAGGIYVSTQDLANYAAFWLQQGKSVSGKQVLKKETIKKMLSQQLYIPHAQNKRYVGLGWRVQSEKKKIVTFFHIGGANHISAWVQMFPSEEVAVLYLGNPPVYKSGFMNFLIGMQQKLGDYATAIVGAKKPVYKFKSTLPSKKRINLFVGNYQNPINKKTISVFKKNGKLYFKNGKKTIELYPYTTHIFQGGRNYLSHDFIFTPKKAKPLGVATNYGFFKKISNKNANNNTNEEKDNDS